MRGFRREQVELLLLELGQQRIYRVQGQGP